MIVPSGILFLQKDYVFNRSLSTETYVVRISLLRMQYPPNLSLYLLRPGLSHLTHAMGHSFMSIHASLWHLPDLLKPLLSVCNSDLQVNQSLSSQVLRAPQDSLSLRRTLPSHNALMLTAALFLERISARHSKKSKFELMAYPTLHVVTW